MYIFDNSKEVFTGGIPYPGWSEAKTIAEIKNGYCMPKPEHVDNTLYVSRHKRI